MPVARRIATEIDRRVLSDEEWIAEPVGGANGDEPFRPPWIPTSLAAHPRRSPLAFALKTTRPTGFLNVDLDIESSGPLDSLAEEMGSAITVLHSGPGRGRRHFLRLESAREADTPDTAVRDLCRAAERLSARGRRVWDRAKHKEFNVGYELRTGIRAVEVTLLPATVKRIVALGATVAFTCYPADNSEPDGPASGSQPIRSPRNRTS